MQKHPSTESLEGAHTFPGPYLFKLFGRHEQQFVDSIRAQIAPHVVDEDDYSLALRPSSKGNFCVVDVNIQAESAEHVPQIYTAFHDVVGLRTLL